MTVGVHPLSWLLSNNRLEKVPVVSVPHTSSNRLLLSNQDKGCTPSVAHSLPLPLGPALINLSIVFLTQVFLLFFSTLTLSSTFSNISIKSDYFWVVKSSKLDILPQQIIKLN